MSIEEYTQKEDNRKIFLNVRESLQENANISHVETPCDDEGSYSVACDIHKSIRLAFGIKKYESIAFIKGSVKTSGLSNDKISVICEPLINDTPQISYSININKTVFQSVIPLKKETFKENNDLVFNELYLFVETITKCCNAITNDDVVYLKQKEYIKKQKPIKTNPDNTLTIEPGTNIPHQEKSEERKDEENIKKQMSEIEKYEKDVSKPIILTPPREQKKEHNVSSASDSNKNENKGENKGVNKEKNEDKVRNNEKEKEEGKVREKNSEIEAKENTNKKNTNNNYQTNYYENKKNPQNQKNTYENKKNDNQEVVIQSDKPNKADVPRKNDFKIQKDEEKGNNVAGLNSSQSSKKEITNIGEKKEGNINEQGICRELEDENIFLTYETELKNVNTKYQNMVKSFSFDELLNIIESRYNTILNKNGKPITISDYIKDTICSLAKEELKNRVNNKNN